MSATGQTHRDRVAVVTGAAGVLGNELCLEFARRGAQVVGVDIADIEQTGKGVRATGATWHGVRADLTSPADVSALARDVEVTFGQLDILVNNAGAAPLEGVDGHTYDSWRKAMAINLDAPFLAITTLLPLMKKHAWGRIVNVGSSSVELPTRRQAAYKASKMGVIGLTRGVAADVAEFGITVNVVSPPFMETPLVPDRGAGYTAGIVGRQSIKRLGEPGDAVGMIMFLTADESRFITGQTMYADGGLAFT